MGGRRIALGKLVMTAAFNPGRSAQNPRGNVFFLHGACDSGSGMKEWLRDISKSEFGFQNFRVLYPSAPRQAYTPLNGQEAEVWFDRPSIGPEMPENKISIDETAGVLSQLIETECERSGTPLEKTVLGGFSTGGVMALHIGYRFHNEIAGIFTLSSFLPPDSSVYSHLDELQRNQKCSTTSIPQVTDTKLHRGSTTPALDQVYRSIPPSNQAKHPKLPQLFMTQGLKDPLVKYRWGKATFAKFRDAGVDAQFFTAPNCRHEIVKPQLSLLHNWIGNLLEGGPPLPPKNGFKVRKYHVNDESTFPVYWK